MADDETTARCEARRDTHGMAMVCTLPAGHGGHHDWRVLDDVPAARAAAPPGAPRDLVESIRSDNARLSAAALGQADRIAAAAREQNARMIAAADAQTAAVADMQARAARREERELALEKRQRVHWRRLERAAARQADALEALAAMMARAEDHENDRRGIA